MREREEKRDMTRGRKSDMKRERERDIRSETKRDRKRDRKRDVHIAEHVLLSYLYLLILLCMYSTFFLIKPYL